MNETWKIIPNFSNYLISSNGQIYSKLSNKYLKLRKNKDGYLYTILIRDDNRRINVLIHRLVLFAFIGPPTNEKYEACHFPDPNKTNNTVSNLRWDSNIENQKDYLNISQHKNQYGPCLSKEIVLQIKDMIKKNFSYSEICKKFKLSSEDIVCQIKTGKKYWYYGEDLSALNIYRSNKKLTDDQIKEICSSNLNNSELARKYHVTPSCISKIRLKKSNMSNI